MMAAFSVSHPPSHLISSRFTSASRDIRDGKSVYSTCRRSRAYSPHVRMPSMAADDSDEVRNPAAVENVVVIGSGPAGYTAAIYAARANLKPLVLEGFASGLPGGQLMTTSDVDNFPGFPTGVSGPELMANMREQAERWGAELVRDDALSVNLKSRPFEIETGGSRSVKAHGIILATGASARRLGLVGEDQFWSRGISACAICDGAAPIYAGQELAVVGGGDSACEEAVYLTKYATKVHLVVRGDRLRASKVMQDRVMQHPNVEVHMETVVLEALGGAEKSGISAGSPLRAVRIKNMSKKTQQELPVRGLFYAIGHQPNTNFLAGAGLDMDRAGYLVTKSGTTATNVEGVFAAGDVADSVWRQAITAAGTGCMAALAAERYLTKNALGTEFCRLYEDGSKPGRGAVEASQSQTEREVDNRGPDDETSYSIDETWHKGQFALRKLYHESTRPLVVKYVSPGCGPCAQLKPMLHSVVRGLEQEDKKVHFVEIDISVDADVAESAGITGSPTVQIFFEKSLIKEMKGVRMKSEYRRAIESCLEQAKVAAW
jgi:thioredoxin reductase (NADPH)